MTIHSDGIVLAIKATQDKNNDKFVIVYDINFRHELVMDEQIRIRKLTPTECFRLMGFTDEDIERCQAVGMSNSQLYKQAGNSIVVPVLEAIFGQMFEGKEEAWKNH